VKRERVGGSRPDHALRARADVTRAAREARRSLAAMSRPPGVFDAARYFRAADGLQFFNVGTDRVRALARAMHDARRERWSLADALAFADLLIVDPHLETKGVANELLARYRRQFTPALLPRWKRWLASNHSANWATTDAICGALIGPLLVTHPRLADRMRAWARHSNLWVRRASIVALIPPMRGGAALDIAYDVARTLHGDRADLIQKAVGWALREAGKADADRLERYLRTQGAGIPRTTVRYAIERFPPPLRRELLDATRVAATSTRRQRSSPENTAADPPEDGRHGEEGQERRPVQGPHAPAEDRCEARVARVGRRRRRSGVRSRAPRGGC
jgi:3-methyladenine DNA glycosylase AlkD